jgi:hypothetical protein
MTGYLKRSESGKRVGEKLTDESGSCIREIVTASFCRHCLSLDGGSLKLARLNRTSVLAYFLERPLLEKTRKGRK